jgi:transcriptional regulator with XRE-family HTH domain
MDIRRLVGRNFATLRRQKGFTQETFAETAGVTQQYVNNFEHGLRNPTIVTLYHLALALGVSHVELVVPDEAARRETAKTSDGRSSKRKSRKA